LIGSCTNSSYEDIYRAASIAREALDKGIKSTCPFYVSPGSVQVYETVKRDGLLATLEEFGGVVLANACGPCIGQWKREDIEAGERNSIVTSFNRNFRARNDANPETLGFISSPDMVLAYAASGHLGFNPLTDTVKSKDGQDVKLSEPKGPALPTKGFVASIEGYVDPAADGSSLVVEVKPDSGRLELLKPFTKWDGNDFKEHLLLVKVAGKCTTDHISPAGKWLRFRGHLDKISDNMLLGATNAYYDQAGEGRSQLDGSIGTLTSIARKYKEAGKSWVIVGDENYGEGSSREHAAMCPRFLGVSTVIVKSFARIHETNLKKQGVLALIFADPKDYGKVQEADHVSVTGLAGFAPGKNLSLVLTHKDGKEEQIEAAHSYNQEQIEWFKAGSALNLIS
jgi:aconitate hydratase